ncbi:MAG: hypothetical protein JJW00_04455 [Sulfurimonas sp.]|nr:hypothetical protein [Sulfurimonas sp.]
MLKIILMLLAMFIFSSASEYDRANSMAKGAFKDLDCEFEDCTPPPPPKVIYKEKIVEKVVVVEKPVIVEKKVIIIMAPKNKNITQCNKEVQAGALKADAKQIALGKTRGSFIFEYETYSEEDRITIVSENNIIFDSGCVGTRGIKKVKVPFSGGQTFVTVQVLPNCMNSRSTSTQWKYLVNCP